MYTSWSVVKVFYTHHTHIKAKGNKSSLCLDTLSSFPSFFPHLLLHIQWRQVQCSTLLFSLPDSHPIHHYVSWSSLTFYRRSFHSLLLSPHFSLSISRLISFSVLTSTSKPLSLRPSERNPGQFSSQRSTYHCEVNHQPFFLSLLRCVR